MATRINDTEVRKRQILEVASNLFLEKGYAGVGIMSIKYSVIKTIDFLKAFDRESILKRFQCFIFITAS